MVADCHTDNPRGNQRRLQDVFAGKCESKYSTINGSYCCRVAKLAVFVDGCFWHGCPQHSKIPKANRPFWKRKLDNNRKRDRLITRTLKAKGWSVLRIWEHELAKKNQRRCLARIRRALASAAARL